MDNQAAYGRITLLSRLGAAFLLAGKGQVDSPSWLKTPKPMQTDDINRIRKCKLAAGIKSGPQKLATPNPLVKFCHEAQSKMSNFEPKTNLFYIGTQDLKLGTPPLRLFNLILTDGSVPTFCLAPGEDLKVKMMQIRARFAGRAA